MKNKIIKISVVFFIMLAITTTAFIANVNAANLQENTNPNDNTTDTITDGTIIIGISKFTPGTIITGVKAAAAGANDMKVYALKNGDTDGYQSPKMYYYVVGEWMEYNEDGTLKSVPELGTLDIYYVNNNLKQGISLPTPPVKPSTGSSGSTSRPVECTVFFMTGEEKYEAVTVNKGSKINKNKIPTIDLPDDSVAKFGGWKTKEGEIITEESKIVSSMVLFPKWEIDINDTVPDTIPSNVTTMNITGNVTISDIPETIKEIVVKNGAVLTLTPGSTIDTAIITKEEGGILKQQVNDVNTLKKAIQEEKIDEIILSDNITITEKLELKDNSAIDLNNKKIEFNISDGYAITTKGSATLKNGNITTGTAGSTNKARAIYHTTGDLNLEGMTVEGYYGITSDDSTDNTASVNIKDSTLNTYYAGVYAATNANVKVDNSTINSAIFGLCGNGLKENTTIEVSNGSTITSTTDAAIYFPCTATLNITDSTVTGKVGIEACAGNIKVVNSTIESTEANTNVYTDEEIKTEFDTTANGTFVKDKSSGSAIFFRIQKPYGKGTEASIETDASSILKGIYGIRVYEASSSSSDEAVKKLTINSLAKYQGNGANEISVYNVVSNAEINYPKTVDLTTAENNIVTKSTTFKDTFYNKSNNQTIDTVDDNTYYMDLGEYTGVENPTTLKIGEHEYTNKNASLSVGNNSHITVPVWKISDNNHILVAIPWLCAEALPETKTSISVGGQIVNAKLYDNAISKTLSINSAEIYGLEEESEATVTFEENKVSMIRNYGTEAVALTFKNGETIIDLENATIFRIDANNPMNVGFVIPDAFNGGYAYVCYPKYFKGEVTEEGRINKSFKLAIPGKGVITFNLVCNDYAKRPYTTPNPVEPTITETPTPEVVIPTRVPQSGE